MKKSVIQKLAEIHYIMKLYPIKNPNIIARKHQRVIELYREIVIEIIGIDPIDKK